MSPFILCCARALNVLTRGTIKRSLYPLAEIRLQITNVAEKIATTMCRGTWNCSQVSLSFVGRDTTILSKDFRTFSSENHSYAFTRVLNMLRKTVLSISQTTARTTRQRTAQHDTTNNTTSHHTSFQQQQPNTTHHNSNSTTAHNTYQQHHPTT